MKQLSIVCLLLLVSLRAGAETTIADYMRAGKEGGDAWMLVKAYTVGLGTAFDWTNQYLKVNKQPPLFCVPDGLVLNADNFVRILDDSIVKVRKNGTKDDNPIVSILLFGLIATFPCNKG